jgi:hypothetical protein
MATRKPATPARRTATPARRRRAATPVKKTVRRRRVSSAMTKAGFKGALSTAASGAIGGGLAKVAAQFISQPLADILGGNLRPYANTISMIAAAVAMDTMKVGGAKSKLLAAGAAGAAGAELANTVVSPMLADHSNIYSAIPMPLEDYEPLAAGNGFYSSDYQNFNL